MNTDTLTGIATDSVEVLERLLDSAWLVVGQKPGMGRNTLYSAWFTLMEKERIPASEWEVLFHEALAYRDTHSNVFQPAEVIRRWNTTERCVERLKNASRGATPRYGYSY